MKLPQANLEGICRDERWAPQGASMSPGVEPLFLSQTLNKLKCKACSLIPIAALKRACKRKFC